MTPADVKTKGTSHIGQTAAPPQIAARCIEQNATRGTSLYAASVEPKGEITEVVVRVQNTGWVNSGTAAFFELQPAKEETVIRGWIHPSEPNNHDAVFRYFTKGC